MLLWLLRWWVLGVKLFVVDLNVVIYCGFVFNVDVDVKVIVDGGGELGW